MKLSIVIPCVNEAEYLPGLLSQLKSNSNSETEVIVVDSNSKDDTKTIAKEFGVKVFESSIARRSIQMDIGAKVAVGEMLLFVHADSIPPSNFYREIMSSKYSLGCFRLKFSPSNGFLRFFEMFVGLPLLICRGGDQGLFISSKLYKEIGGFDTSLCIMEDIDIIRRAAKSSKFTILQSRMHTSSRAYIKYGNYKLQFAYFLVHCAYWLGVESRKIKLELNNFLSNGRVQ